MATDRMIWIDLEMTGLEPDVNRIIEAAVLVTDGNLEIVAEGPNLAIHQPEEVLAGMDDWNKKHHGASGLIRRVRESTISEADAEAQLLAFVQAHVGKGESPLAGNSVHQDRRFLAKYWPTFEQYLHYRIVDVSTIKELVSRWYPKEYTARPVKKGSHRALDDIRESIDELRFYRKVAFR